MHSVVAAPPDNSRMKLVEDDLLALRRELGHA